MITFEFRYFSCGSPKEYAKLMIILLLRYAGHMNVNVHFIGMLLTEHIYPGMLSSTTIKTFK